jgi:hypothetical protein
MNRILLASSLLALSLLSCGLASRLLSTGQDGSPEIIQHDQPELPVNIQPFIEAGCSGENQYVMECAADSPLKALGCDFLTVNAVAGGLNPKYAIATCMRRETSGEPPQPDLFQMTGCLMPLYKSLVVSVDGEYRLVNEAASFQVLFAPIESQEEALAYAQLVTVLNAIYGWEVAPYKYHVERLEDTHVVETDEGYIVSLFSDPEPLCGCATHTIYQRDVLVRSSGQVEILESTPIYDFEACID